MRSPILIPFALVVALLLAPWRAHATDDTDFLFRLGLLEGHLIIGGELMDAGQGKLALPHFGHPVRELYDDIADYVIAHKLPSFEPDLIRLEAAVAAAPAAPATKALFATIIGTVHRARATAPPALRAAVPEMIRICAAAVDAAAGEFGGALDHGRIDNIVEYHDSRGYIAYVAQELDRIAANAAPADQGLIGRFRAVLARAQWIVAPLLPGQTPRAALSAYRQIATDAATVAGP